VVVLLKLTLFSHAGLCFWQGMIKLWLHQLVFPTHVCHSFQSCIIAVLLPSWDALGPV
jgi:hypothetical protein